MENKKPETSVGDKMIFEGAYLLDMGLPRVWNDVSGSGKII